MRGLQDVAGYRGIAPLLADRLGVVLHRFAEERGRQLHDLVGETRAHAQQLQYAMKPLRA